jgi:hypothetical protein
MHVKGRSYRIEPENSPRFEYFPPILECVRMYTIYPDMKLHPVSPDTALVAM